MKTTLILSILLLSACVSQKLETTSQIVKVTRVDNFESYEGKDYFTGKYIYYPRRFDSCIVGHWYLLRFMDSAIYYREIKKSDIDLNAPVSKIKHEKLFDKKVKL